ncbi:MAG: DUF4837 family protein [Calditrichaeota bacterium]|nr:DUF4837 family protein [Calditrichota bacterium]
MKHIRKYQLSIIITVFIGIVLSSCSFKPSSVGSGGTLVIIADETDRPLIRRTLEAKFGRIFNVPQPEPLFNLVWTDAADLEKHTRNPLFLLASTLNGEGSTAEFMREMLNQEVEDGIQSGDYSVFRRYDPWARHQMLLVLAARNSLELGEYTENWCDSLFGWAVEFEYERLRKNLLTGRKRQKFTKYLDSSSDITTDEYQGFKLDLQIDYIETLNSDSLACVRFIRHFPDRWLTVAWDFLDEDSLLTPELIYQRRKSLGNSFLDPVLTYDDIWEYEETVFNGRRAFLIRGLWATKGPIGGGPFFCYGFLEPDSRLYYIVDGAVFAPDREKMPYLWQLEVIARTFKVTNEE